MTEEDQFATLSGASHNCRFKSSTQDYQGSSEAAAA